MQTTWTVVAENQSARVFETQNSREDFREVERWIHPPANLFEASRDPESSPNSPVEMEEFATAVCELLDEASAQRRFDRLRLVAPPKMLGLIRDRLTERAHHALTAEIPKDLSAMDENDMRLYVAGYGCALG